MSGNLLLMDNMKDTLNEWSRYLEELEYNVEKASSLEEAREILRSKWIHLAIMDIRMKNDDDENDITGLLLAREKEFLSVPKIVLTAFPSFEYARLALAENEDGTRPGINLIAKNEGPHKLVNAIKLAFANQIRINRSLEIQTDSAEPISFLHLVNLIEPNLPNDILPYRASELEDLIRHLFYDYQQIRIGRLLWHDRARFCLPVLARSSMETTDSCLLVCGTREWANENRKSLETLAPKSIRETKLFGSGETIHFGVNLYELRAQMPGQCKLCGNCSRQGKSGT